MVDLREMNEKIHEILDGEEASQYNASTADKIITAVKPYWQAGDDTVRNDIVQKLTRLKASGVPFADSYQDALSGE
ncbi:hypothetical protein [Pantoea sp.]|uniref:hypothetical protein n=1 Tax=Pantoea sp. TaxID=69393 RepID=UPI00289C0143|nr:hypothetical protein [Pantoea sp.]